MKILGIDHGTKRYGLALGETDNHTAAPWRTIEAENSQTAAAEIVRLVAAEGIEAIVIGDPLLPSGERGESSARARAFGQELEKKIGVVPVYFVDERLSSKLADRVIKEYGADRDSLAATAILQSYLDALP